MLEMLTTYDCALRWIPLFYIHRCNPFASSIRISQKSHKLEQFTAQHSFGIFTLQMADYLKARLKRRRLEIITWTSLHSLVPSRARANRAVFARLARARLGTRLVSAYR